MSKILIIDDANRAFVVKTSRTILTLEGHDVQGAVWDGKVFGIFPGTVKRRNPVDFVRRIQPDVLFIHFGTNFATDIAAQIVSGVREKCPNTKIVVITNLDPSATFGADYSLQLPYDPDDLIAMAQL